MFRTGPFILKSLVQGAWQGHLPPYARVGRSWARYGERDSMRLVLVDLWEKHLKLRGLSRIGCPIAGLLESGAASSADRPGA